MKYKIVEEGGKFRAIRLDRNGITNWYSSEKAAIAAIEGRKVTSK